MTDSAIQLTAAVAAAVLLGLTVLRHRSNKRKEIAKMKSFTASRRG